MLLEHLGADAGTGNGGGTHADVGAFTSGEDLIEGSGVAFGSDEFLDVELVADGDLVLLATSLDDCVCHSLKEGVF